MGGRQSSSGDNSSVDSAYGVWEKKQIEQSCLSHRLIIKSLATVQGRVRPSALWISDWWHVVRNPEPIKNRLLSLVEVALTGATHSIPKILILLFSVARFTAPSTPVQRVSKVLPWQRVADEAFVQSTEAYMGNLSEDQSFFLQTKNSLLYLPHNQSKVIWLTSMHS